MEDVCKAQYFINLLCYFLNLFIYFMSPSNLITNWLLSTYITILKPIMQKEASTFMYVSILSYASSQNHYNDFVAKKTTLNSWVFRVEDLIFVIHELSKCPPRCWCRKFFCIYQGNATISKHNRNSKGGTHTCISTHHQPLVSLWFDY